MKKAAVFGGSGFIGRHFMELLLSMGWGVVNYDVNRLEYPFAYYNFYEGSTMDKDRVDMFLGKHFDAAIIVNFAGVSNIEMCNDFPASSFYHNVCGNMNVLNDMIHNFGDYPLFIFSSSLYAKSDKSGAYGLTKKHAEDWVRYYADRYGFPYLILRYGTVYGTGAQEENSVRKVIKRALETKTISYYGYGDEVRSYVHVKDVARYTMELALDKKYWNQTFNIMGHESMKSKDFVAILKDILGEGYETEFRKESHPDHYVVSPYAFEPGVSHTYVSDKYTDLGSGLLEVIEELSGDK